MTRAGGCPTASTCRWDAHPESASWRLCETCGVERPAPGVDVAAMVGEGVREPICGPNRSEVAPRATGPQIGAEG